MILNKTELSTLARYTAQLQKWNVHMKGMRPPWSSTGINFTSTGFLTQISYSLTLSLNLEIVKSANFNFLIEILFTLEPTLYICALALLRPFIFFLWNTNNIKFHAERIRALRLFCANIWAQLRSALCAMRPTFMKSTPGLNNIKFFKVTSTSSKKM